MAGLGRVCAAAAGYFAILIVATLHRFGAGQGPDDTQAVLYALLPVQLLLLLLCMVALRPFGWRAAGFGRIHWAGVAWLLPVIAVMVLMLGGLAGDIPALRAQPRLLVLLVAVPVLIGITEEIMFRGIILRAAMARLPVFYAMLLSALLFALMHGIIGVSGQPASVTFQQMGFAFLVGIFLAPIAIAAGNLWVVIIWHAVWDMLVYASQWAGVLHSYALIGIMIQTLISVSLWARLVRADQRETS
ncbi:CAAX protease self-immunity [Yoonia tamlensis]|uniref:CAAX protease self-immunity n=1 Tax=Yoonia tamlensis TaxID=390270 RepID=A0A1I6GUW5_9RHOB|nr:CPBP family intramembrane glutamic endopeptidase [Yoonia tamlensis]SFR45891.1 CAAX protease self-immunity [Yoonia tamlensis]